MPGSRSTGPTSRRARRRSRTGFNAANPLDPHYRWGRFDRQVKAAVAAGLQPIVSVSGAPLWAEPPGREQSRRREAGPDGVPALRPRRRRTLQRAARRPPARALLAGLERAEPQPLPHPAVREREAVRAAVVPPDGERVRRRRVRRARRQRRDRRRHGAVPRQHAERRRRRRRLGPALVHARASLPLPLAEADLLRPDPLRRVGTRPVHVRRAVAPRGAPERRLARRPARDAPRVERRHPHRPRHLARAGSVLGDGVQLGHEARGSEGRAHAACHALGRRGALPDVAERRQRRHVVHPARPAAGEELLPVGPLLQSRNRPEERQAEADPPGVPLPVRRVPVARPRARLGTNARRASRRR